MVIVKQIIMGAIHYHPEIDVLPLCLITGATSWAQFTILSPERDSFAIRLREKEIPSVSYYSVPLHLQPVFANLGHKKGDFPVTEKIADQGISLPINPDLKEEEIEKVCTAIS